MTSTATPPSTAPDVGDEPGRRGGRWPRRRWVRLVAVGLLAAVVLVAGVYASWLGGGLLEVSSTVQDRADIAQKRLQGFRRALKAGEEGTARRHLRAAERAVDEAEAAARAPQVRVAKLWPYTRSTVADLDHLLTAAAVMIDSADEALTLYTDLSGDKAALFADGRIDLDALVRSRDALRTMTAAMDRAESELRAVDGDGPMGDDALDKKRSGLKQITSLRAEIAPYAPVVEALPDAVGANGTRRYLVAIMNPAEMRASGGAPLSMAMVVFRDGKLTIPLKGTTSEVTLGSPEGLLGDSPELVWKRVPGDPFQPPAGEPVRFVNTGFNPDFRVSGEQMMLATPSFFGMRTDGVIAIDVVALAALLNVVGPIESEFGTLTGANLVQELLVNSYAEQGADIAGRQARNDQLMSTMLSNLMAGGNLRAKADALLSVAPARHLQLFFRDERLQALARERALVGSVPTPRTGNLTAVYTQNGNGSKVDVFQQRTVEEVVRLHEDGSATVRRTVVLANPTPPYTGEGPDIRRGYTTRWATNLVINLMPPGATITDEPEVELAATVRKGVDTAGRTFAQAAVVTPPGGSAQVSWEYELPSAAVETADGWRLKNQVTVQNTVNPFLLTMTVVPPEGWSVRRVDDTAFWSVDGPVGFLQISVDRPQVLRLDVVRPAP